jgi:excisionase family DNA binding protein
MLETKKEQLLLTGKELARKFNVPLNTVYYWVSKNEIPYLKVGKHNRFDYSEVMEFFKKQTLNRNLASYGK